MIIKTKELLKDLEGKDLKDLTVGKAISNILVATETGGKMKMFLLAQNFYNKDTVELDAADLALVKKTLESDKSYSVLVTGQLLVLLEGLKEEKKA